MPVDPSTLDHALDAIRRVYGEGAIHTGDEKGPLKRISTGSLELDVATGGGVPMGRWSHWYGGYSSAKTLTAWNVIREAQALGMTCAYYNIEKQYDPDWVRSRGIDLGGLQVVEKATIEDVGTTLETLLGSVHVHVLDSLAAAISIDELAGKLADWNVGLQARAWGKVLRRANERFDDAENTIIMINQVRDVFGGGGRMGGEAPPGGRFIEFMSSLSMHFKRSSWLFRDKNGNLHPEGTSEVTLSGDTTPAGIEFQVRVNKSRVGPPLRTARMRMDFATGSYDEMWTLAKGATHYGIVERAGAWYKLPNGEKVQGEAKLREAIAGDEGLENEIRSTMLVGA